MTVAYTMPDDSEVIDAGQLRDLLADCRAMAAYDAAMGARTPCNLGRHVGGDDARPPCERCGDARDCAACVDRARAHAALVERGAVLRERLDSLRQRGARARARSLAARDRAQRQLDVLHTLATLARAGLGTALLDERAARTLSLAWMLRVEAPLAHPAPVLPMPGPHADERAAAVIEWLVVHVDGKRDRTLAVADAFAGAEQLAAWHPPTPPRKPRDDSREALDEHSQRRQHYRAARAAADRDRPSFGNALLSLAIASWASVGLSVDEKTQPPSSAELGAT